MYNKLIEDILAVTLDAKQLAKLKKDPETLESIGVEITNLIENYEPPTHPTIYGCDGDLKNNGGYKLVIETEDHEEFEKAYVKAMKSGKFLIVRKYIKE